MSLPRLCTRVTRLEARAWDGQQRRLAQMTAAEVDAEMVRLETHYGAGVQDYARFVETLSASELEALCTADLATMPRFLHTLQRWRHRRA